MNTNLLTQQPTGETGETGEIGENKREENENETERLKERNNFERACLKKEEEMQKGETFIK